MAAITGDARKLHGYFDAVHRVTIDIVRGLDDTDLDRVVDERWIRRSRGKMRRSSRLEKAAHPCQTDALA